MRFLVLLTLVVVGVTALPRYCGVPPYFAELDMDSRVPIPPLAEAAGSSSTQGYKLKHVQVVMRHGDRTRVWDSPCWANDDTVYECNLGFLEVSSLSLNNPSTQLDRIFRLKPINNREYLAGDCLLGQLTSQGYAQHVNNGEVFRNAYVGTLLPEVFDPSTVYLRSDDEPRTMQSCQAMFQGLYPPSTLGAGKNTTIINFNYMDEETDNLNPNPDICPMLSVYESNWNGSAGYNEIQANQTEPLMTAFAAMFNIPKDDVDLVVLQDCYWTHLCHNYTVPDVESDTWNQLQNQQVALFQSMYNYPNATAYGRVSMGPFIKELWQNIEGALNGTNSYLFQAYATHDLSVMPLLSALNIMDDRWCPYAGYVVFEIWEDPAISGYSGPTMEGKFVRVIRYGEEVVVPGCPDVLCPLQTFYEKVLFPVIPTAAECHGV